jgi:repressor LexA
MTRPTPTQLRVLECLRDWHQMWGYMPTRDELAQAMGWKSPNAAHEHLAALAARGLITLKSGTARSIRFTDAGLQQLAGPSPFPTAAAPRMIALPVIDIARLSRGDSHDRRVLPQRN